MPVFLAPDVTEIPKSEKYDPFVVKEWLDVLSESPLYIRYDIIISQSSTSKPSTSKPSTSEQYTSEPSTSKQYTSHPSTSKPSKLHHAMLWNEDKYITPKIPLTVYDDFAEEFSFPEIYFGHPREFTIDNVTPEMIVSSELRRKDRRGATPEHVLYMVSKILRTRMDKKNILLSKISISRRFWEVQRKDLFAMVRQLGKPTALLTISATDTPDLLQILQKLHGTEDDTTNLVERDPVINVLYFNKKVDVLLQILQRPEKGPFGRYHVVDYFKRVGFEFTGTPYVKIVMWLANDPKEDVRESDMAKTIQMIDEMSVLGHIHHHTPSCSLKMKSECRFGAPFWPMDQTRVLTPLIDNIRRKSVRKEGFETFEAFLLGNGIEDMAEYLDIVRSTLKYPRVFQKRNVGDDIWKNVSHPWIPSSSDLQFVLDGAYPLATNVTRHVQSTREYTEISEEWNARLSNSTEMRAQEAAWFLLKLPMTGSSRKIQFVSESMKNKTDMSLAQSLSPNIIRWRPARDREDLKRLMVKLFHPGLTSDGDYSAIYDANEETILKHRKEFEPEMDIAKFMEKAATMENIPKPNAVKKILDNIVRKRGCPMSDYEDLIANVANEGHLDLISAVQRRTETNGSQIKVFVTGAAGTGKTFVLKLLMETYNRLYGDEGIYNSYVACAPTGKAAAAIGGSTIHSAFGDHQSLLACREAFTKNVRAVFVDEVSMVGSELLAQFSLRLQQIYNDYESPYGGVDIYLCGDFRQLPPVKATPIYTRSLEWQCLRVHELMTVMRQSDEDFSKILTKIGDGLVELEENERKKIESRFHRELPDDTAVRLFRTRKAVDDYNRKVYKKDGETLGKPYMLTRNVNVARGLVNGAIGILEKVDGIIYFCVEGGKRYKRGSLPLVEASALTIHKAQGCTFDTIVYDYERSHDRKMVYTALSRVTSLEGLYLTKPDAEKKFWH